jgi:hypothetical protein
LRSLRAVVALLALAAVACTSFSLPWQLLLSLAVLGMAYRARLTSGIYRLQFDQGWRAHALPGRELELRLDSAVVWPMLIVLRFRDLKSARRHFPVVLLPDSLDRDGWRRLRLFLNHGDVFGGEVLPAIDYRDTR